MIRYSLQCDRTHQFEAWFRNADAFDRQAARQQVVCPECGSSAVTKAIMAPSVITKGEARKAREGSPPAQTPQTESPSAPQRVANGGQRELMLMMRKLRDELMAKSEYVGPRFADEARKIHNEEAEPRGIHGEATETEVKELAEEGVEVYPLPVLPEDRN